MTLNIQIAVDCRNPHELADWWAETLEWAVEPQDETFIRSMIDQGFATEAETKLYKGRLVWGAGAAIRPPDELDSASPSGASSSRPSRRKRPSRTGSIGT